MELWIKWVGYSYSDEDITSLPLSQLWYESSSDIRDMIKIYFLKINYEVTPTKQRKTFNFIRLDPKSAKSRL